MYGGDPFTLSGLSARTPVKAGLSSPQSPITLLRSPPRELRGVPRAMATGAAATGVVERGPRGDSETGRCTPVIAETGGSAVAPALLRRSSVVVDGCGDGVLVCTCCRSRASKFSVSCEGGTCTGSR